jgi:hypothetical protein
MKTFTAENILKNETVAATILIDALKLIAETNGTTVHKAAEAYKLGVKVVVSDVERLALAGAQELADRLNKVAA